METKYIIIIVFIALVVSGLITFFVNVIHTRKRKKTRFSNNNLYRAVRYGDDLLNSVMYDFYNIFPWVQEVENLIKGNVVEVIRHNRLTTEDQTKYSMGEGGEIKDKKIFSLLVEKHKGNTTLAHEKLKQIKKEYFDDREVNTMADKEIIPWLEQTHRILEIIENINL